jgi:hypothetical protein
VNEPHAARGAAGDLFPTLLEGHAPAPPVQPRGSWLLRTVARVLLWSLIAVGAVRAVIPAPTAGSHPVAVDPPGDHRAEAVAAAFLREYLTVGADQAARAQRLGRFAAAGLDLRRVTARIVV